VFRTGRLSWSLILVLLADVSLKASATRYGQPNDLPLPDETYIMKITNDLLVHNLSYVVDAGVAVVACLIAL